MTEKKVWVYGRHAVSAALKNSRRRFYRLFATLEARNHLAQCIKQATVSCSVVTNKQLDNMVGDIVHQGVALETSAIFLNDIGQVASVFEQPSSLVLILDHLTDQQNVGNLIRSAYAFKASAVLTTKDHSFSETPALTKAACGAVEHVPICFVTNLVSTIKYLKDKGFWAIGLDGSAHQSLSEFKFPQKSVLVLGAEDVGLRNFTSKSCDFLLRINMQQGIDSLNASTAGAIAMYQAMLQI
jgi:23S rRNA (guanosine2251-2'-O)-methyltransferase